MKCNVIGAGRLGKNIALALSKAQAISSLTLCNQNVHNAQAFCAQLGYGRAVATYSELSAADITFICSNDDAIADIAKQLAAQDVYGPGSFIVHCSGVFNSSLLAELQKKGCAVASLHPLKAFKTGYLSAQAFEDVDCVLEGDAAVCQWLECTFKALGAQVSFINPEHKALYHAAACMASNYLITLAAYSEELFHQAGLPQEQRRRMLINLMQGNVDNLHDAQKEVAASLTGPLVRGDHQTITAHLQALLDLNTLNLYKAAALATLPLTSLDKAARERLQALLG